MNIQNAYNQWAENYDTVINKTRDLEAVALRETLGKIKFESILEVGCGTGKNTQWLVNQATEILSVDLSEEMLAKARAKSELAKVNFVQADINQDWEFAMELKFDLVGFSLVLEHIENMAPVFEKVAKKLKPDGYLYIGELHPFKQYNGTKARFETADGLQIVDCFNHNISDFLNLAVANNLKLIILNEYFDENNRNQIPRILTLLFQKSISFS
jgi:SAM-dependent methyltransferase